MSSISRVRGSWSCSLCGERARFALHCIRTSKNSMQRVHPPRPHFATQSVESTARYVTYCVDAVEALGRLVQDWDGFGVGLIYLTGVNKCGRHWGWIQGSAVVTGAGLGRLWCGPHLPDRCEQVWGEVGWLRAGQGSTDMMTVQGSCRL